MNRIPFNVLAAAFLMLSSSVSIAPGQTETTIPDGGAATPHILDLTGEYSRIAFRGNLEIRRTGNYCVYNFPSLTVELVPNLPGIIESAYIDEISMKVDRPMLPGDTARSFVERNPVAIALEKPGDTGVIRNAEFRLSRPIAQITRYVLFALEGRPLIRLQRDAIGAGAPAQTITGRAAWPMGARSNILSMTGDPNGGPVSIKRKTPSDPTDWCAPEKVH